MQLIYQLVKPSHPVLSEVAVEVRVDELSAIHGLIQRMKEIAGIERNNPKKTVMVGLAAPQIGVLKRVILVDIGANGKGGISEVRVYINPKIIAKSEEQTEWYEGCYSTGPVTGIVSRAKTVTVEAFNEMGEGVVETWEGYQARIFQHEIDHLDGRRFPSLVTEDQNLHLVQKEQFPEYRNNQGWRNWPTKCPRSHWEAIRDGRIEP